MATRRRKRENPAPSKRRENLRALGAWVDKELLDKVDALVQQKQAAIGRYTTVNRSDVVRMVLEEHLDTYLKENTNEPRNEG